MCFLNVDDAFYVSLDGLWFTPTFTYSQIPSAVVCHPLVWRMLCPTESYFLERYMLYIQCLIYAFRLLGWFAALSERHLFSESIYNLGGYQLLG